MCLMMAITRTRTTAEYKCCRLTLPVHRGASATRLYQGRVLQRPVGRRTIPESVWHDDGAVQPAGGAGSGHKEGWVRKH